MLNAFINAILPPRCAFTGDLVESQGMVSPAAWKDLTFITRPYCECCGMPFEFAVSVSENETRCASCLKTPPVFCAARSVLAYNDASREFILGFKHGDQCHAVVTMVPWLKTAGAEILADADALVPVPLHRWRLLRRRYNQAALMAFALSKAVNVPCYPDALFRRKPTPPQGHLGVKNRHDNVKKAFAFNPKFESRIHHKKIVLIDDVFTTGATVDECTKVLKDNGAAEVRVLTFAKVLKGY